MKRLLRVLCLFGVSATFLGCAMSQHQMDTYYGSWNGHQLDELIQAWGSPDRTSVLDNGGVVATYDGQSRCAVSVVASKAKIIQKVTPMRDAFWCGDPFLTKEYFPKPSLPSE